MPRYIDADALIERILKLKVVTDDMYGMGIARGIERAETAIQMQPTADVVPKSEVEKAIDDLKRYIILNEDISKKCNSENGEQNEEYWKGKLSAFLQIRGYLDAELKKKYQGGEPNG